MQLNKHMGGTGQDLLGMSQGSPCQGRRGVPLGPRDRPPHDRVHTLTVHRALHDFPLGLLHQEAHKDLVLQRRCPDFFATTGARAQHELPHLHRGAALLELQHELDAGGSAFHVYGKSGDIIEKELVQAC